MFQIRNEHLPSRCEICHQADLFNPEIGKCARCAEISVSVVANASNSAKIGSGFRRRFLFARLKIFSVLFVLAGGVSISVFVSEVFRPIRTSPSLQSKVFEPPIVNKPAPVISVRENEVEISGMLSEAERQSGIRYEWVQGKIIEGGVTVSGGILSGNRFRIRIGERELTCFCPRIGEFRVQSQTFQRCQPMESRNPLGIGNYVYLTGQYDSTLEILFVSRIISRETPFRGDELPQS